MSARILSMGHTTLRFTRFAHEIARRHFSTHMMYIGSPILRFRGASRRSSDPRAAGHMQSVPCVLGTI